MPTVRSLIEHIRRAVTPEGDGELLGRFVERRDERALVALVERHGPMVWGVCRRLLSHHDAEDAFQVTFIVLARKAGSVKPREMVGNWLYGVARQAALQARTERCKEIQVAQMPDVEAPQDRWADVRPILDEELSRLPDHYRAVIVLSDLEGRARRDVAFLLGCPEGTVASRLARARAMLAKRLTQRGVALSGAMVLSLSVVSAVPASLVSSTIKAASLCGQVSLKVAVLTEGVLKTMLLTKLKSVMAVLVVAAMVGLIGYGIATGQQKGDGVQEPKAQKVEAVKEKKEETTAWGKEVDGLQIGLADVRTVRQGETVKLAVKLRNVGNADIKITHGLLREYPPQVTDTDGGKMSVYMPIPKGYKVRVTELTIKPGETITLYNPEVAVESEAMTRLDGLIRVDTPTICVEPGKYKIAFGGMIQSHPKLATGIAEFEVKDQVAWGKEVDGVQIGVQLGGQRVYTVGETVTLIVRLRNNGKKDVPFIYDEEYFQKNPPRITDADGKAVKIKERNIFGIIKKGSVAPGKEVDLCKLTLDLRPNTGRKEDECWTLYGTGKFYIQYKDVPVVGEPRLEAPITTYATGKLELEVKEADDKKPVEPGAKQQKQKDKEAFTEWGKESGGLQAGLGYKPGEKRAYTHGETVTLVVRVRNVSKEVVKFQYDSWFVIQTAPAVTDGAGKSVHFPYGIRDTAIVHPPTDVSLAPGKEMVLGEVELPIAELGTGKLNLQYERVFGKSYQGTLEIDPTLKDLGTGKLELEVKDGPPEKK